jgi:hypothetical protein
MQNLSFKQPDIVEINYSLCGKFRVGSCKAVSSVVLWQEVSRNRKTQDTGIGSIGFYTDSCFMAAEYFYFLFILQP